MKLGYSLLVIGTILGTLPVTMNTSFANSCSYTAMGDVIFCGP